MPETPRKGLNARAGRKARPWSRSYQAGLHGEHGALGTEAALRHFLTSAILLTAFLVFLFLSTASFALGIRPAKSEIPFMPGQFVEGTFVVMNNEPNPQKLRVYVEGPALSYVTFPEPVFTLDASQEKVVRYTVQLPESSPGAIEIYVNPDFQAAGGVSAIVRLAHRVVFTGPASVTAAATLQPSGGEESPALGSTKTAAEEVVVNPPAQPESEASQPVSEVQPVMPQDQQPAGAFTVPALAVPVALDLSTIILIIAAVFLIISAVAWLRSRRRSTHGAPAPSLPPAGQVAAIFLIAAVLGGVIFFADLSPTGYQSASGTVNLEVSTRQGDVFLTIQSVSSLTFAIGSINFGTGFVNTSLGNKQCTLDSEGTNRGCINFTSVSTGLILENDGNNNLTVSVQWNKNKTAFIGGDETLNRFAWKASNNETGSCGNFSGAPLDYTEVNTTAITLCDTFSTGGGGFNFLNDKDTIRIDVNITIPYDALAGPKNATITATGTTV